MWVLSDDGAKALCVIWMDASFVVSGLVWDGVHNCFYLAFDKS